MSTVSISRRWENEKTLATRRGFLNIFNIFIVMWARAIVYIAMGTGNLLLAMNMVRSRLAFHIYEKEPMFYWSPLGKEIVKVALIGSEREFQKLPKKRRVQLARHRRDFRKAYPVLSKAIETLHVYRSEDVIGVDDILYDIE